MTTVMTLWTSLQVSRVFGISIDQQNIRYTVSAVEDV